MIDDVTRYVDEAAAWSDEMAALRPVLLDAGLDEAIKWGKPCYCWAGGNVAIMQPMKRHLALMFFTGALLEDPDDVLVDQGPNSRSARRLEFTSVDDVERVAPALAGLIDQAKRNEEAGLTVESSDELVLVAELQRRLDADPELAAAFASLTPGRQREYHLHISGAKKSETRISRIDKLAPRILAGKGLRDR